ncbi:MAG TPA: endonuclease/exonuclease/phosphatase family protein [Acidimicrobiales bacterium]|nr:endonuclease/exonuclease/phosphatase family protein [Acidimicrobiales bacterium]
MNLRVASFNVRFGLALDGWNSWLPFRWLAARTVVRHLDADLLGLQEAYAFQTWCLRQRGFGMTGDGRNEDGGGERCSVLYRKDRLRLVDSSTRWYGDEPFRAGSKLPRASHPRITTIADVELGDGQPFTFVNTHLDQRYDDNRVAAARQLVAWLGDGPTIVVGDLNAKPGTEPLKVLEGAGLRSALPPDSPGTNHDFGRRDPWIWIDHILVSEHWKVRDTGVLTEKPFGRHPSDHWPLYADLTLATTQSTTAGTAGS